VPSCPEGIEIDEESELYVPILIQSYARESEKTIIAITCKTINLTKIHSEGKRSSIHVMQEEQLLPLANISFVPILPNVIKKKNYVVTYLVATETVVIV
jgi:hypothetical protein